MTDETDELRQRIAELEERVAELENTESAETADSSSLLDRYDSYVMEQVESVADTHPRRLMELYEESGVVNTNKQKKRAKRLMKMEGEE
jgi:uncharacterized protein YllA (UPF0747 family)